MCKQKKQYVSPVVRVIPADSAEYKEIMTLLKVGESKSEEREVKNQNATEKQ